MNRKRKTMRTIRRLFGAIAAVSFLLILGTIGGIENNSIELIPGTALASALVGTFTTSLVFSGAFEQSHQRGAGR